MDSFLAQLSLCSTSLRGSRETIQLIGEHTQEPVLNTRFLSKNVFLSTQTVPAQFVTTWVTGDVTRKGGAPGNDPYSNYAREPCSRVPRLRPLWNTPTQLQCSCSGADESGSEARFFGDTLVFETSNVSFQFCFYGRHLQVMLLTLINKKTFCSYWQCL